ncbi:MAG: BREX-3 system phosphatase PglZ [Pseudodesulfovibrio sp.]|uniref:PglZ domain protein n=1 Tax=Pseudodesulfovibrio aespoeensis (strain ATCC 700646 / DSM 10631 / Aspo-2) TaxID=643562 RepID=E6VXW4_PSEA9|nr:MULTISPECIES: BREX-3 system phosphatase PglZ [Pseudodesulfovibrio]ADU62671.1 PglZ domain protein [Pseudodesulfovibrio aespoeensis Aspo-2]MBV1763442.1 BREX-3 system phosphatase PglZ [Pseudodesulfovibrio sp.]MBV1772478.1 BREX-3 system phosphatase PglZ [Pseudodesulfovibrio sp.]MCG2731643.1 BREX-3 system phosphatase PglZ [Pseudodesulfovibrio aespoeensis]
MSSWRDAILNDFVPNVSKLTLVADPDCLLTEEKLALELRGRGFDLIEFSDPVEFRYAYESKYRSIWDRGEHTDLVVVLRLQNAELESLPYDLLQAGRKLSFNLGDLFPNLSYPVIEKLDRSLLDALFEAQRKSPPDRMGDNATKDFILRHVFGIAAELIANEVELLRALLRLHYGKLQIPLMLAERLIQVLKGHDGFKAWPLSEIVPDDEAFFAFLQERWPLFLSRLGSANQVREDSPEYGLKYPGPDRLPFDHQDIKVYIDNLFLEGKLTPVEAKGIEVDAGSWVRSGIATSGVDNDALRISHLFDLVEKELPTAEARYSDWTAFALKWAELSSLVHCGNSTEYQTRLREIGDALNTTFAGWLTDHYSSLINLPPTNPAMLHHVPRRLARDIEDSGSSRAALIVVDGLALDQWVTIRQLLQKQDANLVMRESATFAWIPTLTSVSRQSIFSGKPPLYFPSSINSTNSEEKLWKQFWEGHGLSRLDVAYQRGLGDGDAAGVLDSAIHPGKTKVVGLVVDKVDKIMHGMQLGSAGMHNQIKQWCQGGFLAALVGQLLEYGYEVWLTADHGNIQCEGKGRPSEGVIAETRGERVRVYPTPELRAQVAGALPFAHEWQPVGLPADYFPLVAGGRDAFVNPGDAIVGHGGVAIEEVIVPLVKFERRTR